jgi:photosystem II stability/assembly factor-like uncharacterized protein
MTTPFAFLALLGLAGPPALTAPAGPLDGLAVRPLGPAAMSGRLTSLAVVESNPAVQYVGAAAGGVWKTTDAGRTWSVVFPGRPHPSIGAIALSPSRPAVVWVGTGEANARNSVSWGNGVFVSRDAGKTWRHAGLSGTRHIGRIVVHPTEPDHAYVAAVGRLWGPNAQRGVFRTRDGGKTWEHALKIDDDTGCIDLVIDPTNPRVLHAAAYRVRRGPFSGPDPAVQFGPRAGIYRTTDAGASWKRVTRGLPTRPMGRIGLAVWRKDPRLLYAVIATDRTDIRQVRGQPAGPARTAETGGVFLSRDRGETWAKVNDLCPRPFYFAQLRIDPNDPQRVYVLGIHLHISANAGRTFTQNANRGDHVDHHDLWIDPNDSRRLALATDGGLYTTRDRAFSWQFVPSLPVAQFYGIALDMRTPYFIYGGLQDNGSWGGPSQTRNPAGILNSDWFNFLDYDGFQCAAPADDPSTVYAEGQYGLLNRIDLRRRAHVLIRPRERPLWRGRDTPAFRFNWSAPVLISPHDTKTLYFGGNFVFKTTDRGQTWRVLGPDLTRGTPGRSADHGHTLSALAESPRKPGLLYAGSDDGALHVSRDDGKTWADRGKRVAAGEGGAYTRVECSPHADGTAWASLSRHRRDDTAPYLYRTTDFGATWRACVAGLPGEGPVLAVRADPRNDRLVYAGTEFGLYVSFDAGSSWQPLGQGLPPVPVHDLVVHPRDRELVIATHGRGLFILDAAPLQACTPGVLAAKAHLFEPRGVRLRKPQPAAPGRGYAAPNPPEGAVLYYRLRAAQPSARLEVLSPAGEVVWKKQGPATAGLHGVLWKPEKGATGTFQVRLLTAGETLTRKLRVEAE